MSPSGLPSWPLSQWEIRMESKFMKPGEDALLIDNGLTNKWRWAWIEEIRKHGKPFGSSCKKLRAAGACSCTLCSRKLIYATSGKKVLPHPDSEPTHRAAVRALQHTTRLPGATTTADVPASMADRVCENTTWKYACAHSSQNSIALTKLSKE